jgi:hypothetical protein
MAFTRDLPPVHAVRTKPRVEMVVAWVVSVAPGAVREPVASTGATLRV